MNETSVLAPEPPVSNAPGMDILLRAASDPNCDVNKAERIMEMVLKMNALKAEQVFNTAMSACQSEMPAVFRDACNDQTRSRYTRLESLHAAVVPVTAKHGFSMSFGTADCPTAGYYRITCRVAHSGGHSILQHMDLANDNLGPKGLPNKTLVHGAGSSISYGRRYLTMMIFNVALTNTEDDDGNAAGRKAAQAPGKATEKTRAWFVGEIQDIKEEAINFALEHAFLAPEEPLEAWHLDHVPISRAALATLRGEIIEWAR